MSSDKFTRMARTLPGFYKAQANIYIRGLLKAWGIADDAITINIQETKDQIFVSKADGRYLDFLGNNVGVPRFPELSIADEDFRKLIPVMSFYPKQVRSTIIALLDVFWGEGFTRANVTSNSAETYNFGPVTTLTGTANFRKGAVKVEGIGTQFTLELNVGDYIKPTGFDGTTYAKVSEIIDDTTLELTLPWEHNFSINTPIAKGVIKELDYKVNKGDIRKIRFKPNLFSDITAITVQELVNGINNDPEHNNFITANVFLDPILDNRLNIRTNTPGLQGSIQIIGGDANLILNFDTNLHTELKANVFEINPNEIVVKIPSTVPILRRTLKGSSHPRDIKTVIQASAAPYDFTVLGPTSSLNITVDGNASIITFTHALDFVDPTNVSASELAIVLNSKISTLEFRSKNIEELDIVEVRTTDGSAEYQITGGTANSVINFPTTLQQDKDLVETNFPSAYIFDPTGQLFTVTGRRSELDATIPKGSIQTTINLQDSSNFPNSPGLFMVNFGRSGQEGPIKYNSRPNNSSLLIDAAHIFQNEHIAGRTVNFVSNGPTIPRVTGDDYGVYIVGTEGARIGAQDLIKKLIASGVVIRFIIDFPEFLFECVCGCPEDLEDPDKKGSMTSELPLIFK